jgi:hypothetical protein
MHPSVPTVALIRLARHCRFPHSPSSFVRCRRRSRLSFLFRLRPNQQILVAMTDNLVITAKHILDELNVNNDGDGRADHPLQANCRQQVRDMLNKFIDNNDGDDADSTYRTKMLQLID